MKMIIGGAVAFLFGIYTIIIFSASFFDLLLAVVPVTLILAGGLMIYLNRESLLSKNDQEPVLEAPDTEMPETEDPEVADPEVADPEVVNPEVVNPEVVDPEVAESEGEAPVIHEAEFVGNTDSKVFHTQGCAFAQSKKCIEFFVKKEDAVQAGYKPCSRCNS